MQWQLMPQCRDKSHIKHHNMNGNHSASDESTSLCVTAALSERLSLPVTSFDVAVSASQWRARLVRRTQCSAVALILLRRTVITCGVRCTPVTGHHWRTVWKILFFILSQEGKEKGFKFKTASRLLQFPPLCPMPNTAFPKIRFRASRAANHVDDEPVLSRDAAMS